MGVVMVVRRGLTAVQRNLVLDGLVGTVVAGLVQGRHVVLDPGRQPRDRQHRQDSRHAHRWAALALLSLTLSLFLSCIALSLSLSPLG